jgi:hypothetical protein
MRNFIVLPTVQLFAPNWICSPQPAFFDVPREIYDEANSILYSMTIRTLSLENGGLVDAGDVPENQGRQLWLKLTCDNYQITRDGIPLLKLKFYDQLAFRQTKDTSVEMWANQVRMAAATLTTNNGNPIPEDEQTLVFRKGILNTQLREHLILPSRTETFEQLVVTAKSFTATNKSSQKPSERVLQATGKSDKVCAHCLEVTGRSLPHATKDCRQKIVDWGIHFAGRAGLVPLS